MPIDYKEYPPNWLTEIRPRILARANNCCEWCDVPNGVIIKRTGETFRHQTWDECIKVESMVHYSKVTKAQALKTLGLTKVVLTIAHLNHDKQNHEVKDENLAALCQRCHLKHDMQHHTANRKYGRNWQGGQQLKLDI